MKKQDLIKELQSELERTYHNATLHSKLTCESDYECDLVQSQVEFDCQQALHDLPYGDHVAILDYGEVYQWGRGGRTVAPTGLIKQRGGSSFRIKRVEELYMTPQEMRKLLKTLKAFNDYVIQYCSHVTDSAIEYIRTEFAEDLEANKDKKRVHFSGVRYE